MAKIHENRFLNPAFKAVHDHNSANSSFSWAKTAIKMVKEGKDDDYFNLDFALKTIEEGIARHKKNFDKMYNKYKELAEADNQEQELTEFLTWVEKNTSSRSVQKPSELVKSYLKSKKI